MNGVILRTMSIQNKNLILVREKWLFFESVAVCGGEHCLPTLSSLGLATHKEYLAVWLLGHCFPCLAFSA
jgi:hypothetical protein